MLRQAAEAAGAELVTGAEVTAVRPGAAGGELAAVTWRAPAGERVRECDLVVAADGVWSTVRDQLFAAARPRYAGSTSWRAVIPDTGLDGRLTEVWGPGTEFGALRVSDGEIYWYGEFACPEGTSFADELEAARARFAGWSPWIRGLIAATAPGQLTRHDVYHLPGGCPSYVRGRVVLAGDAAHAMLPTLGQGAATALEDAVCAGRMIAAPVSGRRGPGYRAGHFRPDAPATVPSARPPGAPAGPVRLRARPGLAAGRPQHPPAAPARRPRIQGRRPDHALDAPGSGLDSRGRERPA